MKAWVLEEIGRIGLKEIKLDPPGPGEAQVMVMACGVCGSDIPRIYETGAHQMPLVPGHEFSGVVIDIGTGVPYDIMHKRVAVCPKIPCGKCACCRLGYPEGCEAYDFVGSRRNGGFAELVNVPASQLLVLPGRVSYEAGAMLEPLAVAANAVRKALGDLDRSAIAQARVALCGLGTVGLLTLMLLKRDVGLKELYVVGNKDIQKEKAECSGVDSEHFCDSRYASPASWLREKAGGVDIYIECVGSKESVQYGLEALLFGGRLVLVGNPRSDMAFSREAYWKILRRELSLIGVWNSSFRQEKEGEYTSEEDDWHYALRLIEEHRINPAELITHRFSLEELEKGFLLMRDRSEEFVKVMYSLRKNQGGVGDESS